MRIHFLYFGHRDCCLRTLEILQKLFICEILILQNQSIKFRLLYEVSYNITNIIMFKVFSVYVRLCVCIYCYFELSGTAQKLFSIGT